MSDGAVTTGWPSGHSLLVRSGSHRCGIPVDAVRIVAQSGRIEPLPGSSPRLLGLAQISGEPVAVVDLHALIDPESRPGGGRQLTVVVGERGGRSALGLAVDEALGVTWIADRESRADGDPEWVVARCCIDGRSVALLDPEQLLATADEG
jgi:chemotaxis signal transduction protein